MIVRTSLMAACMIVVPGLALCSHHLPAEVRAVTRCDIWQPLAARVQAWFAPTADRGTDDRQVGSATTTAEPVAASAATTGDGGGPRPDAERLTALGAVAFECRPLEAETGMHVASCRVAMDAAGQLHRVFQAPGPSPEAATGALVAQVEAWRQRLAMRAVVPAAVAEGP